MIITGRDILETEDLTETIVDALSKTEYQDYSGRLHASKSGYCPRQGALEATYKGEKEISAVSTVYFDIGNSYEKTLLDGFDRKKKLLFRQYAIPDIGINLGGKVDGIVIYNGKIHALEIKTCGALPTKPKPDHLAQVNIYSAVTGFPGLLAYASRHVQDKTGELKFTYFDLGFQHEAVSKNLYSAAYAFFASKNGLMPEIPDHITSVKHCGFCNFKNVCWGFGSDDTHLEYMSDSEKEQIENRASEFIADTMHVSEITKRRNGILKYLSENGNKTAKFYLKNEDWDSFLTQL